MWYPWGSGGLDPSTNWHNNWHFGFADAWPRCRTLLTHTLAALESDDLIIGYVGELPGTLELTGVSYIGAEAQIEVRRHLRREVLGSEYELFLIDVEVHPLNNAGERVRLDMMTNSKVKWSTGEVYPSPSGMRSAIERSADWIEEQRRRTEAKARANR